jgi:DNA repair exonuclease SbcCD ATPase subunit
MIQFKKLIVHNFGSYGHAELDLQDRGFCLVSGQNLYIKDNAISNGSGKSFLWSAVCFALTGETINGIKTNLKNINAEDNDCYVQLEFNYNKDSFMLSRIIAPKSDLKIYKNNADLSGKGIRESEKKLQELLPDLSKDLIASTIIIGQGMPNKFSSFSPSGRKELLEKLTKSDFMIADLKQRVQDRQQELTTKAKEINDSLLVNNTQLKSNQDRLQTLLLAIQDSNKPDFESQLNTYAKELDSLASQEKLLTESLSAFEEQLEKLNTSLFNLSEEKAKVSAEEIEAFNSSYNNLVADKNRCELTINNIKNEIDKIKAIVDTCPTCGQKIPNIQKPDVTPLENQLNEANSALQEAKNKLEKCLQQHQEYTQQIEEAFKAELNNLNSAIFETKQQITKNKTDLQVIQAEFAKIQAAYNKVLYDKQNWDKYIENQKNELANIEADIARLTNLIEITNIAKEEYDQRLSTIKKMDSLIRRDFRGYLLSNIIDYIDNKAKDYCNTVFGTRDLSLCLNGNALDITYCNKVFDGLSGGEKQRVDLILQLAIRDLLTSYLDLSSNILVLDEITDFLDKKSCQAVMQLLEKELKTVESVFIISHHSDELGIPVDSEVKVIKNTAGISELY